MVQIKRLSLKPFHKTGFGKMIKSLYNIYIQNLSGIMAFFYLPNTMRVNVPTTFMHKILWEKMPSQTNKCNMVLFLKLFLDKKMTTDGNKTIYKHNLQMWHTIATTGLDVLMMDIDAPHCVH